MSTLCSLLRLKNFLRTYEHASVAAAAAAGAVVAVAAATTAAVCPALQANSAGQTRMWT